jgi:regulatory protein
MSRITELKPQKNRTDRYNLYLDDVYKFPVSANTVLAAGLHVGMEIDEAELQQIRQSAEIGNAHDKALNYLDLRRRSIKELHDYLRRKEYEPEVINQVVDRLMRANLLNDEEFARAWVRDRLLLKPKSKRALSVELAQKGISRSVIDAVLIEMEEGSEQRALEEAVSRKLRQTKYATRVNDDKLIASLVREGYSYSDIKNCLRQRDDT